MAVSKAPKQVTVTIFTTITIIFWIFLGIYRILTSVPPPEIDTKILETINPSLDEKSLNSLEGRIFYEEGQVQSPYFSEEYPQNISPTPQPTKTPTPAPTSTLLEEGISVTPTIIPEESI